jgi:peptide/nickel transport system ATP-binding protein
MGLAPELADRYPHELSGGQVQRGLLAMSLILDPPVLILDEPTAALDAVAKSFVAGVIQDCKARKKSVLLITHDLDLAGALADEIAVLYLGQVMETLPGRHLLERPAHPYTLALARAFPTMEAVRDLGGIRGDAFYRMIHAHAADNGRPHVHTHVAAPDAYHQGGHAPPEGCLFKPRCTQAIPACAFGTVAMEITPEADHRVRCIRGGIAKILKFTQVAKSYGKVAALHPTDLTLMAGEVFCLVGETGSGKTTLAMIAAGAAFPDQGTRTFQGRDMDKWIKADPASLARRIGIIYQNPAESVSHRLTVFEIVAEPLRIHKTAADEAEVRDRVRSALSDVRLSSAPEFLKRYPHELNMGAVQRVCLARALVHEPDLLIADEPTSALDPSVQAKVLKMLLTLQIEKGLTLLFVTHNIGLARKVADRIGVMAGGRMVETGAAARIIHHPEHDYTRTMIQSARGLNASRPSVS